MIQRVRSNDEARPNSGWYLLERNNGPLEPVPEPQAGYPDHKHREADQPPVPMPIAWDQTRRSERQ